MRPAPRLPDWPAAHRGPGWLPAMLVVTAIVAALLGFLVGAGPAVCHAPAGIWL